MRDYRVNERFRLRNSEGEEIDITVISQQEEKGQIWVNIRPDGGEVMSLTALQLTETLIQQGVPMTPSTTQDLTPEEAILAYEARRATAEEMVARAAVDEMVTPESPPEEAAPAAPARPPTPMGNALIERQAALARALDEAPDIREVSAVGGLTFYPAPDAAIAAWHEAQLRAISHRMHAEETEAAAMLDACEGRVKGQKLGNEQARKAYATLVATSAEASALRAEAEAKALQFWVERLASMRR